MKKYLPENSRNAVNNGVNNLVIEIIKVNNIEVNHVKISTRCVGILGDNGTHACVLPARKNISMELVMVFSR